MATETRIPSDVDHSITVRSVRGVPVVAERFLFANPPWDHRGLAAVTGSPVMATRWLLPTGSSLPTVTQDVAVFNPGRRPATVTATFFDQGKEVPTTSPAQVVVPAGGRATLSVPSLGLPPTGLATVVTATTPVVVEQTELEGGGDLGIASAIAIPAPAGLRSL